MVQKRQEINKYRIRAAWYRPEQAGIYKWWLNSHKHMHLYTQINIQKHIHNVNSYTFAGMGAQIPYKHTDNTNTIHLYILTQIHMYTLHFPQLVHMSVILDKENFQIVGTSFSALKPH